jgi:ankyrin repeat protein
MTIKQIIERATPSFNQSLSELKIALDRSGCQYTHFIIDEATHSFKRIQEIVEQNITSEALEKQIREFFKFRGNYIVKVDADHVALPFSPINQLCAQLARYLANPDEALIQVLYPALTVNEYDTLGSSLIELTEIKNALGERELNTAAFIFSQDKRAIIPLLHWFESKITSADRRFSHQLFTQNNQEIELKPDDLHALQYSIMPESFDFFELWDQKEKAKRDEGTLSALMIKFCADIHALGEGHPQASSTQAAPGAYPVIKDFFAIWDALPKTITDDLNKLLCWEETLEYYLEYLRSRVYPEQYRNSRLDDDRKNGDICIMETADQIKKTIDQHCEKFIAVKIGDANQPAPSMDSFYDHLNALKNKMTTRLKTRQTNIQNACFSDNIRSKQDAYRPYANQDNYATHFYEYFNALNVKITITCYNDLKSVLLCLDDNIVFEASKHFPTEFLVLLLIEATRSKDSTTARFLLTHWPTQAQDLISRFTHIQFNEETCLFLLQNGAPLNLQYRNLPIFIYAAQYAYMSVLQFLLDKKIDINQTFNKKTALHVSMSFEVIQLLLENNADVNAKDAQGATPLELYMNHVFGPPNQAIIFIFLKHGASFDFSYRLKPFLCYAVEREMTEVINFLSDKKINVNETDNTGKIALHYACEEGNSKIIQLLLNMNSRIDLEDSSHQTPFMIYLKSNSHWNDEVIYQFLLKGAPFDFTIKNLPFITEAASKGLLKTATFLFEKLIEIKENPFQHTTLLHAACMRPVRGTSATDPHRLLIQHLIPRMQQQISAQNPNQKTTPLQLFLNSSIFSDQETICLFIQHGAAVNFEHQQLPFLLFAAKSGWYQVVGTLINNKIDINQRDGSGMTALQWACHENHVQTLQVLLMHQADVNLKDNMGCTALENYISNRYWSKDILRFLFLNGAQLNYTPLSLQDSSTPSIRPRFTNAVAPLQNPKPLPTCTKVLEYIQFTFPLYATPEHIILLLELHQPKELFSLRRLHLHVNQSGHEFKDLCQLLGFGENTSQQLLFYAAIQASRLVNTAVDHPCYTVRQRKAEQLYSAIKNQDLRDVMHTLQRSESRYKFWKTPAAMMDIPTELQEIVTRDRRYFY